MAKFEKAKFKPTNTQLNKLKYAAKNKTGKSLRITKKTNKKKKKRKVIKRWKMKSYADELFLTSRQMMRDIKLTKALLSKIIQSGGFLWDLLSKLDDSLKKAVVPLAEIFWYHQPLWHKILQ